MKYQCTKCFGIWGEGHPETEGYSHGLCFNCLIEQLTPIYRRRQQAEGSPDCFRKSFGSCSKVWCLYHQKCTAPLQAVEPGPRILKYVSAGSHLQQSEQVMFA